METRAVEVGASGSLLAVAGAFVVDSLHDMIIWLIVVFSIILCDLITGSIKSIVIKEKYSPSTAFRRTISKTVTYFSFIIMGVLLNRSTGCEYSIDKIAVGIIALVEVGSIIVNIFIIKGYNVDLGRAVRVALKNKFGIEDKDLKGIVTRRKKDKEDGED